MLPKHYVHLESIADYLFNRWDIVTVARYEGKDIAILRISIGVTGHCSHYTSVYFLLFICKITVMRNDLKTRLLSNIPNRIIFRWTRTKQHCSRSLGPIRSCDKLVNITETNSIIEINNAIIHRVVYI